MKNIYRLCILIAAAIGAAGLTISALSIIRMLKSVNEYSARIMWDSYMEGFYHYQYLKFYLFAGAFILFLVYIFLKGKREKLSN
jgi:TRAP-type mannitol/chloroaromatic compound transport system permease small subunit